jgi:hypothetical protein
MATPPGDQMQNRAEWVSVPDLSPTDRHRMYELMTCHFDGVTSRQFHEDLNEKDWSAVLRDAGGLIQGFSLVKILHATHNDRPVRGIYSGDTVSAPDFRGDNRLIRTWAKGVQKLVGERPDVETYWIILTANYRVYEYLPSFFRNFYPRTEAAPADWPDILAAFLGQKFPDYFDAHRGIVSLPEKNPVKGGKAIDPTILLDNPHAHFFVERNPGYLAGEFLACITHWHPDNITRFGKRMTSEPPRDSSGPE